MNIIQFLLRNSRGFVVLITLIGVIGGLCNAGLIALINAALTNQDVPLPALMISFAGLCVLTLASNIISQFLLVRLSQDAILDLRLRLSRQILKAPLRRIEEAGAPRLLAALTGDANALSQSLFSVPMICVNVATLVMCLVYVSILSKPLLIGLLIFLVVGMLSYWLPTKKAMNYMRRARKEMDKLFAHFHALTEGNKELKLHRTRREEFFEQDLSASALDLKSLTLRGTSIHVVAESWGRLLYFILIGMILFVMPLFTPVNGAALTGYVLIILFLMGPIGYLLGVMPTFTQAQVALRRLEELGLSLKGEESNDDGAPSASTPHWSYLELRGVTHSYRGELEGSTFTLGPLDVSFQPGELVFLVGGNGSGKSTFAKILTGLYIPESGTIELDGKAITDETREEYRQFFSAIFSDFYLFKRLPGSSISDLDEQAREYLVHLQLDHKVTVKEGMVITPGLSYGQRKRLALLTSYLEDRPFYVFDEWASDQDPFFKRIFYTEILPELKRRGKTILVISHDDRYYHVADRIIKLDYGQYQESWSPSHELLSEPSAVAL
jgi:putative ATP-binding cassette transporter